MKQQNTHRKVKKLKREIEKRKFPFISVEDQKTGKVNIHPLTYQQK